MPEQPYTIPERFLPARRCVENLAQYRRYLAAYIFGSVARGEATPHSDLDVHVIVDEDNPCANVNHPIIEGVKLDLSFRSLKQIQEHTHDEIEQRERTPILADALLVFDKTGELSALQAQARQVKPRGIPPEEHQFLQFMFFHGNDKVERNLETDPITALFVMHVGLNEWLKYHYRLQQKWWVSSKKLLADLRQWDLPLVELLEQFIATSDVHTKFTYWSAIIDHILAPLGGRQPIAENNCDCIICTQDLALMLSGRNSKQ